MEPDGNDIIVRECTVDYIVNSDMLTLEKVINNMKVRIAQIIDIKIIMMETIETETAKEEN